jgi:hypothetical protein
VACPGPYAEGVFGRAKTPVPTGSDTATALERSSGKGHPTPRRKDAEKRNLRPVVGGEAYRQARQAQTKEERKQQRKADREAAQRARLRAREALVNGDESQLPARDRGPARRFARVLVDTRRNLGEIFLPIMLVILLVSMIPTPATQIASLLLLYMTALAVAVDTVRIRRRVQRQVEEKYGESQAHGVGSYAMMRSLQMRRTRLPKPQIARGEAPR